MNIIAASTSWAGTGACMVTPVDSPTVPNAEITSNMTCSKAKPSVSATTSRTAAVTTPTDSTVTLNAWRWGAPAIRRRATTTSGSPLISAQMTKPSSRKVVTLIPPAVEALPPPMNISARVTVIDSCRMSAKSTVLNPPERGIAPLKIAASTLSVTAIGPNVCGFVHSIARYVTTPTTSRDADPTTVSSRCTDHRWRDRNWRPSSISAGKPRLPATTPAASGTQIHQSPPKLASESSNRENPALLNAVTLWNTPFRSASGRLWPYDHHQRSVIGTATATSKPSWMRATRSSTPRMLAMLRVRPSAVASRRVRTPSRRATSSPSRVAAVMIPYPPTWADTTMMAWPASDQNVVSTTVRPVTQTADTAVNSATTSGVVPSGSARAAGSSSSRVLTAMAARKATGRRRAGCRQGPRTPVLPSVRFVFRHTTRDRTAGPDPA